MGGGTFLAPDGFDQLDFGWLSFTKVVPQLALAISPSWKDNEGDGEADEDGWSLPDPPYNPANVWGKKNDLDHPPPSTPTTLSAQAFFMFMTL